MRHYSFSVSPSQRYLENQTTAFDNSTKIKHLDGVNSGHHKIHLSSIELKFKPRLSSNYNDDIEKEPQDHQYFTPRGVGFKKPTK